MACSSADEPAAPQPPSWDEFQQSAARQVDGRTIYVVEWDLALSLDELRVYYDQHVARGLAGDGVSSTTQESTVNQVGGVDDVWANDAQRRLTYCVSNDFGALKARVVSEMASATHAWEAVANVNFRYVSSQDASCNNTNTSITFSVRPWSSGGACAFFPSGGGCVERTLVMDIPSLDPADPSTPNVRTVGVFRHELGHILGLRHEHTRPEAGVCFEDSSWRAVTPYDQASVMHYPWCNGVMTSSLAITNLDRIGINRLYPFDFSSVRDPDEKFDLNNDGRADLCGRGASGVYCALSTGAGFGPIALWQSNFSDANGWNIAPHYSTIRFPDLNGDHRADICGRGNAGVLCALGTGAGFGPLTLWSGTYSDGNGWGSSADYYSTIRYPDLNGDGRADVCGRGVSGVHCALSSGAAFGPVTLWTPNYSDAAGWNAGPEYYSTIRFPDLNGDGRADVCGRGNGGVHCGLSLGTSFAATPLWASNFSDTNSWNTGPEYYSTIRFPDINGDGRADVCGRGNAGILCGLSTGLTFGAVGLSVTAFSDANGWNTTPAYYGTLQFGDVNADGRADVCGRGTAGIYCSQSGALGFGPTTLWIANFTNGGGWNAGPYYYATIRLADVTGDGRADVCGRGSAGIHCAPSTGGAFTPFTLWTASFRDADGWQPAEFSSTIRLP